MGQLLTAPVKTKESSTIDTDYYKVGSSSMQGWRVSMEDAHCTLVPMDDHKDTCYFAVFDGHGGDRVALHVRETLHHKIVKSKAFASGDMESAIRNGFLEADNDMFQSPSFKLETSGSTGIIVMIRDNKLFCGNVGDSRAFASVNGDVVELSHDHKPTKKTESNRIIKAGGWIDGSRVNGNLALSRAFGDFNYKIFGKSPEEQVIAVFPDVMSIAITEDLEFVVLACDGIWDCKKNSEVLDFVRQRIEKAMEADKICEELMDACLAPVGRGAPYGTDNMTVVIVIFLHGKPYKQLTVKCEQLSETQIQARKPQSMKDMLDSDDDDEGPELPPRPTPAMQGGGDESVLNEKTKCLEDGDKDTTDGTKDKDDKKEEGRAVAENGKEQEGGEDVESKKPSSNEDDVKIKEDSTDRSKEPSESLQ